MEGESWCSRASGRDDIATSDATGSNFSLVCDLVLKSLLFLCFRPLGLCLMCFFGMEVIWRTECTSSVGLQLVLGL